ncbi:Uncharacterised protein [Sebaldella termitidis]|uniref:Uncharacterized protein n=1 Tax=Sebaldella termitidis (strain ATCC 33386 / NCTC 11300) TaxID=526218 RepID=D1AR30_SEBTE|nr:hypothetical protein [Sebaldella termitidis]ACZ07718.1 hypothetical protein Sterm_0846 [Sebaldella termitidis ATCC 33386]SUI23015.1 Uncharacterised protein [Sebaldella termitidis]
MKKQFLLGIGIIIFIFLAVGSTDSDKEEKEREIKEYAEKTAKLSPEEKAKIDAANLEERRKQEERSKEKQANKVQKATSSVSPDSKTVYEDDEIGKELRGEIGHRAKKITIFDDGAIVQVEAQDGIDRKMVVKGMVRDSGQILEKLEKISKKHGANSYQEVTIEFFFDLRAPDGKVSNEKIFRITKSGSDIKSTFIHPVIQQAYSELYE